MCVYVLTERSANQVSRHHELEVMRAILLLLSRRHVSKPSGAIMPVQRTELCDYPYCAIQCRPGPVTRTRNAIKLGSALCRQHDVVST